MSLSVTVLIDLTELLAGLGGALHGGAPDAGAQVEWSRLPGWLAADAAAALSLPVEGLRLSETRVYVQADLITAGAAMAIAGLSAAEGVTVVRVEARPGLGDCLACDLARTPRCHHCRNLSGGAGIVHRPVSAAMAADLFRLVREEAPGVVVLVSAGRELVPVVRFVEGRGTRVVAGGFSPGVRELSLAGSGMVDLSALRSQAPRSWAPGAGK